MLLARRCGLACDCYGPCSDSKVIDAQFGYERAVNALLGLAPKPRLLSGIGEIQAGVASCLEVLVIDDEVLNNVRYALTPRPWDVDALDVDAMVDGALSGAGSSAPSTRATTSAASSSARCSATAAGSASGSPPDVRGSSTWPPTRPRSSPAVSRSACRTTS